MAERVTIVDVTLRDGLQDQSTVMSTKSKVEVGNLLVAAGYTALEVTSFVRPQWVPQMADAEALLEGFQPPAGVSRHALVPNQRGLDRALRTDVECVTFVVSASTAHNEHNLNRTTEESLTQIRRMAAEALAAGRSVKGGVATAFGCPFVETVSEDEVARVVEVYLEAGIERIGLADTIGVATPESFERMLTAMNRRFGGQARFGVHLHDRGAGVGEIVDIALNMGIRSFDAALGGLGGCPFAPGAPGNCKAEELVPLIEGRGFDTGIDPRQLPAIALTLGLGLGRGRPVTTEETAESNMHRAAVPVAS